MRPVTVLLAIGCAILSLGVVAPIALATSPSHEIHLTKDCHTYDGQIPSLCTISGSDYDDVPVGTKVWYQGPLLTGSYFLSSRILLETPAGPTADGWCIFNAKTSLGMCTFFAGTADLTGFHALLDVTIDADGIWHLDGTYYLEPSSGGQPTRFHSPSPRAS